jgi:hypothetical protein
MKKLTSYSKRVKYTYVKTTLATLFVSLFFLKGYAAFEKTGENYFHVFLNGNEIERWAKQTERSSFCRKPEGISLPRVMI